MSHTNKRKLQAQLPSRFHKHGFAETLIRLARPTVAIVLLIVVVLALLAYWPQEVLPSENHNTIPSVLPVPNVRTLYI